MNNIESLIESENWNAARHAIQSKLKSDPSNHWLLTRLGLTYYEQRKYRRALNITEKALAINPKCPLGLWDYAGCLEMLKNYAVAIKIYERLIHRGITAIAFDACGEGIAWARGLIADCHYRLAHCYLALHNKRKASAHLSVHLSQRGPGCRSIYSLKKIKGELRSLQVKKNDPQALRRNKVAG